nr:helix-turn-helix domain-containing protein [Cytophagales bacterium]
MTYYQHQLSKIRDSVLPPEYIFVQIRQSKLFMDQYFSESLRLNDMAEQALISKFHYVRLFKRVYGKSPFAYLKEVRMEMAKRLLRGSMSVTDACFSVGYQSLSTFSGAFKKSTGLTPSQFRQLENRNL